MSRFSALRAADSYCRYLASHHYENFSVASLALPPDVRLHLARIYAFCRTTDDLGDEPPGSAQGIPYTACTLHPSYSRQTDRAEDFQSVEPGRDQAVRRLYQWRDQVEAMFTDGAEPIHPVLLALSRTVAALSLGREPFLDLIAANVQDQLVTEYDHWDALQAYCRLSAAPVGRLVLRVFGVQDNRAPPLSDDVCIGLQLANFAQDVRVDLTKGRTYLLQSELQSHGVTGAVRLMCDRAERLLSSGWQLEQLVPSRFRVQLVLYRLGGLAILSAIRRMDYRTEWSRPQVSTISKIALVPRALTQLKGSSQSVPITT